MGGLVSSFKNRNKPVEAEEEEVHEEVEEDETVHPILIEPGESQLSVYLAHLSSIPSGAKSRGQVKYVRLLKKKAFLAEEAAVAYMEKLRTVGSGVKLVHDPDVFDKNQIYFDIDITTCEALLQINDDAMTWKSQLENLLCWKGDETDHLFDLFDLSDCPEYAFISHRWAADGTLPLGLHNELIAQIANTSAKYIWLDVGGIPPVPSDAAALDSDLEKVIWNMDRYLKSANHVISHYALDGLVLAGGGKSGKEGHLKLLSHSCLSYGMLLLFQTFSKDPLPATLQLEMYRRSMVSGNTLWCNFERLFGSDKEQSSGKSVEKQGETEFVGGAPPPASAPPASPDVAVATDKRQLLRSRNRFSLKCSSSLDMEPLTSMMHHAKYLPAVFTHDKKFHCLDPLSNRVMIGLLIPDKNTTLEAIRMSSYGGKNCIDLGDVCLNSNGWYYDWKGESWAFHLEWPQNETHPLISLHAHKACILKCREKAVYVNLVTDDLNLHKDGMFDYSTKPCMLCQRKRNTDENGVVSKTWTCFVCKYANDMQALSCSKCFEEEMRRRAQSNLKIDITSVDAIAVGSLIAVRCMKTKDISMVVVSRVYGTGMFDVEYEDGTTEQYVDEGRVVLKRPDLNDDEEDGNDKDKTRKSRAPERICGVCWFINSPVAVKCDMCSGKLVDPAQDSDFCDNDCASPIPIGTKVNFKYYSRDRRLIPGTGVVCKFHRFGLYDVELDDGYKCSYINEDELEEVVEDVYQDWHCAGCNLLNAANSIECKACNLQKGRIRNDMVFRFRDDAMIMLGAKVEVHYHGGDRIYPGIITHIRKNGTYDVDYDHGEVELRVKENHVRVIGIFCGLFA
jgi:hypothetical protein